MGLESHVNRVIDEAAPELRREYAWGDGLRVKGLTAAKKICKILDDSGEFGRLEIHEEPHKLVHVIFWNINEEN